MPGSYEPGVFFALHNRCCKDCIVIGKRILGDSIVSINHHEPTRTDWKRKARLPAAG